MKSSVAVVILNWNGKKHLETFLPSVVEHSNAAAVYLADNQSSDDSIEFVKNNYPNIEIIENPENGGFAKGYNQALANLTEDYFVLLNSDVEVTVNWIEPVIELMEQNEKIVIAQPKIKSYLEKEKFEYAGAAGGFIDFLGYPFCRGRLFDELEVDKGQYDDIKEVFWATGACMFISSAVFKKLNGFDEVYFAHMEEIDLCWRAKNIGYSCYYQPKSTVYHLGGGTLQNTSPRKTFLNFRNSLITLYKNDSSGYRYLKVFLRLVLDAPAFLMLSVTSGLSHSFAVLKAHFSFYGLKKSQSRVVGPNLTGMYSKSIVLEYYLKKKKKFSQLNTSSILSEKN